MTREQFVEKLLFDYDLKEVDERCDNMIRGALLEATEYKDEPRKLVVKHL